MACTHADDGALTSAVSLLRSRQRQERLQRVLLTRVIIDCSNEKASISLVLIRVPSRKVIFCQQNAGLCSLQVDPYSPGYRSAS